MLNRQKILIISHGHPRIIPGGGENAAYNLFKELRRQEDCDVIFLAYNAYGNSVHLLTYDQKNRTSFETYTNDGSEIILTGGKFDYFIFSQLNTRLVCDEFRYFLESFAPTIVHFHHYLYVGLECIREVRKYSQNIPIIMTLHDYQAICPHYGQMVKTSEYKLCYKSNPVDCHKCFPQKTPEDFQLRELYIKSFFNLVDLFIAPSQFLLERYVDWGLAREKIIYLGHGQPKVTLVTSGSLAISEGRTRFSYFGQLNMFKGILVVLESIEKLTKEIRKNISLDIYGANLELQPESFQNKFSELLNKTKDCVHYMGPYKPEELPKLMANVDWVIVSSIWWENAPLVIEEAFSHKRPVICSNIGGMAEKVEHEKSGLHFEVGNPIALAECITRAATSEGLWEKLSQGIAERLTIQEVADKTHKFYLELQEKRSSGLSEKM